MQGNNNNNAFVRVLSNLAKAVLKIKCNFNVLPPNSEELGYTYIDKRPGTKERIAQIFINPTHEMFIGLSEIERYMFAFGVAVHEMLHQRFTDFNYFERKLKKSKPEYANLYSMIDNIFEDSRIEFFGNQCFGGWALKCLKFAIQKTWDMSEDFTGAPEPNQIIAALIQYGDTGKIKGSFSSNKAAQVFCKLVQDYFEPAVHNPVGSESIDLSFEATDYLLSQYPAPKVPAQSRHQTSGSGENARSQAQGNADQQQKQAARNKTLNSVKNGSNQPQQQSQSQSQQQSGQAAQSQANSQNEQNGQSGSSGQQQNSQNGQDSNGQQSSAAGNTENNSNSSNSGSQNSQNSNGSDSSANTQGTPGEASSGSYTPGSNPIDNSGEGVEGEDDTPSEIDDVDDAEAEAQLEAEFEEAAKTLQQQLDKAEAQIESEVKRQDETTETLGITNDPEANRAIIRRVRTSDVEVDQYNRYDEKHGISAFGDEIAEELATIFRSKNEGWERSTRGKLNLERYLDPNFNSPFVFDRKLAKANDVAVAMLIDNSGSMDGYNRIDTVRQMAASCAEAFNTLGVPFAVYGHDGSWDDVDFRIYKDFDDEQWYNIVRMEAGNYNLDGASIRIASDYLKRRDEANKVLIVMSDGLSHNVPNAELSIREAAQFATVCGVALATEEFEAIRQMYGENFIVCNVMEELPEKLTEKMKELAVNW